MSPLLGPLGSYTQHLYAAHQQGAQSAASSVQPIAIGALRDTASSASLAWIASKPAVSAIATALRNRKNLFLCRWHTPQTRLQCGALNKSSRVALVEVGRCWSLVSVRKGRMSNYAERRAVR